MRLQNIKVFKFCFIKDLQLKLCIKQVKIIKISRLFSFKKIF